MKKLTTLLLVCAVLTGCGEDEVEKVKTLPVMKYGNYTYGKVLDNFKVCDDSKWDAFENNGVKRVTFTCTLRNADYKFDEKVAEKHRQDAIEAYIKYVEKDFGDAIKQDTENVQSYYDQLRLLKEFKASEKYIEFEDEEDKITYSNPFAEIILFSTMSARKDIENGKYDDNDKEFISTLVHYGYDTKRYYGDALKNGMTDENKEFIKKANKLIKKYVIEYTDRAITNLENGKIKQYEDNIARCKKVLEKEQVKKDSEARGLQAFNKYAYSTVSKRELVFTWDWNSVTDRYVPKGNYIKGYGYNNKIFTEEYEVEYVIYVANNNIETYMGMKQVRRDNLLEVMKRYLINGY